MPDERKARHDAHLSEIARVNRLSEDVRDAILDGEEVSVDPNDLVIVPGHASGAKPHGPEVPWNFEPPEENDEGEDEDAQLVQSYERASKIVGKKKEA